MKDPVKSASDKRYFPRWEVKNKILYRFSEEDRQGFEGRTRDISCTGTCFMTSAPIPQNQKLIMKLYLLDESSIEVYGQLIWVKNIAEGQLVGVNFMEIDPKAQDKILKYAFSIRKKDLVNHWFEGIKK